MLELKKMSNDTLQLLYQNFVDYREIYPLMWSLTANMLMQISCVLNEHKLLNKIAI